MRDKVEATLAALQEAGYVARDEATGEWKFLNERERTIEQAIQEMVRPGGPKSISIAAVRRTAQQMCKDDVVTKKKLANFAVTYGATKVPFSFGVRLDGEAVETGPDLEVHFTSPLASGRKQEIEEIRRQNQAAGAEGQDRLVGRRRHRTTSKRASSATRRSSRSRATSASPRTPPRTPRMRSPRSARSATS